MHKSKLFMFSKPELSFCYAFAWRFRNDGNSVVKQYGHNDRQSIC